MENIYEVPPFGLTNQELFEQRLSDVKFEIIKITEEFFDSDEYTISDQIYTVACILESKNYKLQDEYGFLNREIYSEILIRLIKQL